MQSNCSVRSCWWRDGAGGVIAGCLPRLLRGWELRSPRCSYIAWTMITPRISFPLTIVRTAGLLAVMTIAVLSLVPGYLRPSVPIAFQHFIAYFIAAVLLSFGYCNWNPAVIASPMSLYALVLEIAQNVIPGRTPALMDFAEGAIGTVVGVIVARFILSIRE